jgi:hypothetical protein
VTLISASFIPAACAEQALTLKFQGVAVATWGIKDWRNLAFSPPLRVPEGQAVSLELAAAGASVDGHVVVVGFTTL